MKIKLLTYESVSGKKRTEKEVTVNTNLFVKKVSELFQNEISNKTYEADDWYNNDIIVKLLCENIKIVAEVSYSFSSQIMKLKYFVNDDCQKLKEYENDLVKTEFSAESIGSDFVEKIRYRLIRDLKLAQNNSAA